jgi:hypothetical protein
MKLLLIWLLGVPVLVASMVLVRGLPGKTHRVMQSSTVSAQPVSGQVDFDHVA